MTATPPLTLIVCRTRDPHRQSEALRAALGVTLRGARVEARVEGPLLTPLAERAVATLKSFGHLVEQLDEATLGEALHRAHAVEVWT